jgi:uncharacterized membrane protein
MRSTKTISMIAIFVSLIIASDYALAPALNIKLLDTLVFSASFVFGFRVGASIAIVSELIWSVVSPYGLYLPIVPFLVAGELLYVAAGFFASKIWGKEVFGALSSRNLYFGAILAICAFVWDLETNIATGLLYYWPKEKLLEVLVFEVYGIPFSIFHELSDFILGAALAPIVILYCRRLSGKQSNPTRVHVTHQEVV